MSMKNSKDTIWNRTSDLAIFSAVYYTSILILGKVYEYITFYQLKEDRVQLGRELMVHNNSL